MSFLSGGVARAVGWAAALVAAGCEAPPERRPASPAAAPAERAAAASVRPALPAARAVPHGDPAALARLEPFLSPPVARRPCGPYLLVADLAPARVDAVEGLCGRLAAALEGEIERRLGLAPAHPPRGTIVVFGRARGFRDAVAAAGDLPAGYAAWTDAPSGVVALAADGVADAQLARTLAHELAHLAERRLFGFPRPRWLSEGLADAIGDSATPAGFRPLEGFVGAEDARRRWLASGAGRAGALERLLAGPAASFDRGPASLDYELSALFVRFLLLDAELAPRFRAWLRGQSVQQPAVPPLLAALEIDAPTLERRFDAWVVSRAAGASGPTR